jgi:hypothetical protein
MTDAEKIPHMAAVAPVQSHDTDEVVAMLEQVIKDVRELGSTRCVVYIGGLNSRSVTWFCRDIEAAIGALEAAKIRLVVAGREE